MSVTSLSPADFAADELQTLLHRVDEHLDEIDDAIEQVNIAADGLRGVRSELRALHRDLVFGDAELSPSARLIEDLIGKSPPLADTRAEVVRLVRGRDDV